MGTLLHLGEWLCTSCPGWEEGWVAVLFCCIRDHRGWGGGRFPILFQAHRDPCVGSHSGQLQHAFGCLDIMTLGDTGLGLQLLLSR